MTHLEFKSIFKSKTDKSSCSELIEFGLNICERLLPEYISFSEKHQWGNVEILKECMMFCRKVKEGDRNSDVKSYLDRLDPIIPDMDDLGDFDSSYALNASCAVYELLEYLSDKDKSHIFNISTYMTDTIDFKLSEANPNLTNEELENHPDIVKEWKHQLTYLDI